MDSVAGNVGPRICPDPLGRQRRTLLPAHSLAERIDNRCVPSGRDGDFCTPDPHGATGHWRVVSILRSPYSVCRRMGSLRNVETDVSRAGDATHKRRRRAHRTGFVWPHLCLLRMLALRLPGIHRHPGTGLAAWSPGTRLLHGTGSRCRGTCNHLRDNPPSGGSSRSHHDELVCHVGLDTELFRAAHAPMGDAARTSMVRAHREPGVGRLGVDHCDFSWQSLLGLCFAFTLVNEALKDVVGAYARSKPVTHS